MDPLLESLLRHNGVPTDAQASQLKRLVDGGEAELSQLQKTSATLSLLLAELNSQSTRLSDSLNPLRGAASTFRRFPPEILGEIFTLVLRAEIRRMTIADQRRAAQLLAQVCSYWHTVPQLWTKMMFPTTATVNPDTASIPRNLFARSQNLPLCLSIVNANWPWEIPMVEENGNTRFFEILWESHHRFKDLTLEISPSQCTHLLPSIFAQDTEFPKLEFLSLAIDRTGADPFASDISGILNSFQRSPLLHSLDLYCDEGFSTSPLAVSSFPWPQLTHMRIHMGINLPDTLNVLVQCRRLESARISLGFGPGDLEGPQPIITLPNLRELYYAVHEVDAPSAVFFEALSLPKLENLSLDVGYLSPHAFRRFCTRSGFQLRHLYLERVDDFTAEQLLLFIKSQPTLESLSLINCRICNDPTLFGIFTHHPTPTLPHLRKLALGLDFGLDGTTAAEMAEFLSQHAGGNSPFPRLETLYLMTHSCEPQARYEEAVEARLSAVVATGFVIREVSPDPGDITEYIKIDGEAWR
ncbi:hypothetical protein B0H11DRAFT_1008996 [Mycena galericulata]|nr:hypothetical protein B0H11DRAFT_1008996 [Mycena galericulata]